MNAQRALPIDTARVTRLARCAIRRLRIRGRGTLSIAFIDARRMRQLNKQFLGHDWTTDVLSFRYDGGPAKSRAGSANGGASRGMAGGGQVWRVPRSQGPCPPGADDADSAARRGRVEWRAAGPATRDHDRMVGEILIAPRQARAYAKRHKIPYTEELARYVVHGLLHWLGHDDRTVAQQRAMRAREDHLLAHCMAQSPITKSQSPHNHQYPTHQSSNMAPFGV